MIHFACPFCHTAHTAPASAAGTVVRCGGPSCGLLVTVPAPPTGVPISRNGLGELTELRCHGCRRKLYEREIERRAAIIGHSSWSGSTCGGRGGPHSVSGSTSIYGDVDFCPPCAAAHDAAVEAANRLRRHVLLPVTVILLLPLLCPLVLWLASLAGERNKEQAALGEARAAARRRAAERERHQAERARAEARAEAEFPGRVKAWVAALRSGCGEERLEALRGLAEAGPKAVKIAVPGLRAALGCGDLAVRKHAAEMLQGIGKDALPAAPELVACLWHPQVKPAATSALVSLGEEAVPALTEGLRHKNRSVRAGSAQALAKIGPGAAGAVPQLISLLAVAEDREVAVEALGPIGAPAVPALIAALDSKDWGTRRAATMVLGHIGAPSKEALPRLVALVEGESNSRVREVAELAIRRIKRVK